MDRQELIFFQHILFLATCSDGIQNPGEDGVDCGGETCPACPSCSDGVQNQKETGVDCGGECEYECGRYLAAHNFLVIITNI